MMDLASAAAAGFGLLSAFSAGAALAFHRSARRLRAVRRAALEEAACAVDCACPPVMKAAATTPHHNSGARWRACPHEPCGAIEAACVRALADREAA